MKLDKDCIRGILLALEENPSIHAKWTEEDFSKSFFLKDFSQSEIRYCIERLTEGEYLNVKIPNEQLKRVGVNFIVVDSLSWKGHEFLDTIRNDKIWDETKQIAAQVGNSSIPVLLEIGKSTVMKYLKL